MQASTAQVIDVGKISVRHYDYTPTFLVNLAAHHSSLFAYLTVLRMLHALHNCRARRTPQSSWTRSQFARICKWQGSTAVQAFGVCHPGEFVEM